MWEGLIRENRGVMRCRIYEWSLSVDIYYSVTIKVVVLSQCAGGRFSEAFMKQVSVRGIKMVCVSDNNLTQLCVVLFRAAQ